MAKAVAKVEPKALPATASKYAGMGQDTIERDDIYMPRLKLGQSMSDEVKAKSLEEGDLFNSITGEVICPAGETIPAIIVYHFKEYILWDDRKGENRGLLARASRVQVPYPTPDDPNNMMTRYKWDKPNTTFEVRVDGKHKVKYTTKTYVDEDGLNEWGTQLPGNDDSPPAAQESQNYVLALPSRDYERIAVSLSKTSVSVAKKLNTNLKFGKAAIFERVYQLGSFIDNRGENKFANFQFSSKYDLVESDVADDMFKIYKTYAGKNIIIDSNDDGEVAPSKQF